jgi:hypothetical protein
MRTELQRVRQQRRCVDVRISVDLTEAQKLGVFQAGNQAQNSLLFAEPEVILKSDQVEAVGA